MENQDVNPIQGEDLSNWSFTTPEEITGNQPEQQEQPQVEEAPAVETAEEAPQQENVQQEVEASEEAQYETVDISDNNQEQDIDEGELEGAVLDFLSDRLGREITSFDDFQPQQEVQLDERIEAIARFVSETGRDPRDWFLYQQLNASEMDDMTAISVQMSTQYPNLSQDEIRTLVGSKYKLDSNLHTEDEIKLSELQLKMDAQAARDTVSKLRDEYAAPVFEEGGEVEESFVTEEWLSDMNQELDALDAVEFDLGNGGTFNFGLDPAYKAQLANKNSNLDDFFNPYVQEDGNWNHDKFNVHMAVLDNIETIVSSVYNQGLADGKRGLVDQAANVSSQSPNQGNAQPTENSLSAQLKEALGGSSGLSFNI